MAIAVDLSVVIPAYNEARRLPPTLRAIGALTQQLPGVRSIETIVADDGSCDATLEVAEAHGARTTTLGRRGGVGRAARQGMLAARGARVLLCDADGPVPFEELEILYGALDAGYQLAAGSRVLDPHKVEIRQPWHRVTMGRTWAALVRQLLPTQVRDTQCGFKLFTREAAHALFSQVRSHGFAFHVEVLSLAEGMGMRIIELPVRWRDRPGSKVRLVRDSTQMLGELVGAAWRHRVIGEPS